MEIPSLMRAQFVAVAAGEERNGTPVVVPVIHGDALTAVHARSNALTWPEMSCSLSSILASGNDLDHRRG